MTWTMGVTSFPSRELETRWGV